MEKNVLKKLINKARKDSKVNINIKSACRTSVIDWLKRSKDVRNLNRMKRRDRIARTY